MLPILSKIHVMIIGLVQRTNGACKVVSDLVPRWYIPYACDLQEDNCPWATASRIYIAVQSSCLILAGLTQHEIDSYTLALFTRITGKQEYVGVL